MTNEEVHLRTCKDNNGEDNGNNDDGDEWHANGDAGGGGSDADQPPAKESDPLQPKMVKSKSLKEVKEVRISYSFPSCGRGNGICGIICIFYREH